MYKETLHARNMRTTSSVSIFTTVGESSVALMILIQDQVCWEHLGTLGTCIDVFLGNIKHSRKHARWGPLAKLSNLIRGHGGYNYRGDPLVMADIASFWPKGLVR